MKEITIGDTFTSCCQKLRIKAIENDSVVLINIKTGKCFTYGLDALKRTLNRIGYELKEGEMI